MGVLACNRVDCENIMCDYYSHEHGYLCWECLQELKEKGACDIEVFMGTVKEVTYPEEGWEEYVDTIFKSRFEED